MKLCIILTVLILLLGCGDEGDFRLSEVTDASEIYYTSDDTIINNPLLKDALMTPIAEKVLRSVVYLIAETDEGSFQSSGFCVADQMIATSYHNVKSETPVILWVQTLHSTTYYKTSTIVAQNIDRDIIVFSVEGLTAPPLTLADSDRVAIGERCFLAGSPKGLKGTFSSGIVSGIRENVTPDKHGTVIQISAPTSTGSSGSPVVNALGNVMGITSFVIPSGNDLTFATPSNALRDLLSPPPPPDSPPK